MRLWLGLAAIGLVAAGCGGGDGGSADPSAPQTVEPPAPVISTLSPNTIAAGGAAFTLTVNGSNFVSSSVVDWNGAALQTTYGSATRLSAQVPAADIGSSGTANVTVANGSGAGGTSAAASFTTTAAQGGGPAPGSGPSLVQFNQAQTQGNADAGNTFVQFKSTTKSGDTIWVAVTLSDFAGAHAITVSDTQGNTYTQLLPQENDGAPGTQTVAQFYAANIAGDSTSADTVTVNWSQENYKGVLIAEISGTTATPLVGHSQNIQDNLGVGSDNVTAGPVTVTAAQTPALLVALSMNTSGGASDTGGNGGGGPTPGTGLAEVAMLWNFGANLATFATETITGAESVSSVFSATSPDSYVTVTAVFH
jgi:hypothetical protein